VSSFSTKLALQSLDSTTLAYELAERVYARRNEILQGHSSGLSGNSGIALLFSAIGRLAGENRWSLAAHEQLKSAAQDMNGHPGLFAGLSGLLFSAACIDANQYAALISSCIDRLSEYVAMVNPATIPSSTAQYDLISGAAGILIALDAGCAPEQVCSPLRQYLLWLCSDPQGARWRVRTNGSPDLRAPCLNLGVAHGIVGALSSLAFCAAADELRSTLPALNLLEDVFQSSHRATVWPTAIADDGIVRGRQAWCYGAPGFAAVLLHLGIRLNRHDLLAWSENLMLEVANLEPQHWCLADHAFCHGTIGNAMLFHIAGRALNQPLLEARANELTSEVIAAFNPDLPYGFRSVGINGETDDVTILTGAAGIALSLLYLNGAIDGKWLKGLGLADLSTAALPL